MTKLTDLSIRKLQPPERGQKTYFEGEGFGVRVSQGGTKTFVQMHGKDRRLISLGRYPEMSLKEARTAAKALQIAPDVKRVTSDTKTAVRAFLDACEGRLRPATVRHYATYLNRIETGKLEDITRSEVSYSNHAVVAAKAFFNWCIREELIDRSPVQFSRVVQNHRNRFLSPAEIKLVWTYEAPPFSDYLKLLLLTGQRKGQLSNFEIRDDSLFFPAEVMKGKSDHSIPLLPLARKYAERITPFNSWSKSKARMDSKVTIPHWVVHDLRRTFATLNAAIGTPIQVTEKILDHRSGTISGVSAIYNRHSYFEEAKTALAHYENHLRLLTAQGSPERLQSLLCWSDCDETAD